MQRKTPTEWAQSLPPSVVAVRARVGSNARKHETVGIVALDGDAAQVASEGFAPIPADDLDDMADQLADLLADAGWPVETPSIRLHAVDADGKQVSTYQHTQPDIGQNGAAPADSNLMLSHAVRDMSQACIRMMDKNTAIVATLGEVIVSREDKIDDMLLTVMESGRAQLDAEQAAYESAVDALLADVRAESAEGEEEDTMRAQAMQMLQGLASRLGMGGGISPEQVAAFVKANPSAVEAMMDDEEITSAVWAAIQRNAAAADDDPDDDDDDGGEDDAA